MNNYLKIMLYGALIWVVPYALSMALFPTGIMTTMPNLFKNIMTLSGSITGLVATVLYFKKSKTDIRGAWIVVIIWLVVNWLLDFALLMPYTGYDFGKYFLDIGISYPAMVVGPLAIAYTSKK
ncbi:Uncharacterised protein [Candidatus Tiddalikarchaeum anstoanum]|nr:Uncharacterised protein [Candidatus Tiddalikarchaeum anstoanum]